MKSQRVTRVIPLSVALSISLLAGVSHAQIGSASNSDVNGYFGTTSEGPQINEASTPPTWTPSGPGFYPTSGLPNVPALYPTFPNPQISIPSTINFIPSGHQTLSTPFTDGITSAGYSIIGGVNGAGTLTEDAYVDIALPGTVGMFLNQPPPATGYAYEQANFAAVFPLGPGGTSGSSPAPRPFIVYGNVLTGGYAQFGANVNYWYVQTIPGTTTIGSTQWLGTLVYDFQIGSVSGPFSQIVNFNPTSLLGASGAGFLVITGDAFVAGDPMSITVQSVPEPSSVVLLAVGLAGLGVMGYRRRATE
ncbi:MAG TPA: PEP-CTERM sorting domain-containing protein [Pirellulales bacterium]|jgi:hypothetical protein